MLFFEVFYFAMEVVVELGLEGIDLLSMFGFFVVEIAFNPLLFFPQLSNFKISFLVEPDKFHVQVT